MELPKRKTTRIPAYDYTNRNYYFVTVCTHDKKCIFGKPGKPNRYGKIAEECLQSIAAIFPGVYVDKYVVMPNHIHGIIVIDAEKTASLTHIIGQYKMTVTKKIHKVDSEINVWQRSFYDHIIRNQADYERIWLYIHGNPQKWDTDCYFEENSEL